MSIEVRHGDCFQFLPLLESNSVDAVVTDPPYGTTDLSWDDKIDLATWWQEIRRVIKPNGVVAVFSQQPFTTDLIVSNRKWFRYELIWKKTCAMGFLSARERPLRAHENVLIFSRYFRRSNDGKRAASTYNPQFTPGKPYVKRDRSSSRSSHYGWAGKSREVINDGRRYPIDVIEFSNRNGKSLHPTQKPLELLRWLVLTYTNPGELVLDPFAGSGTTLVACQETGRNALGFERAAEYVDVIRQRLQALPDYENNSTIGLENERE
ncbi:MAG: site-specific DNA-methyltransferase [Anaerolineaceae bacterium]|nr:site-specific DNA-methyltransferase [Anaerolineaceae bacterium]